MLTMTVLPDREAFLRIVDRSRGSVLLQLPDRTAYLHYMMEAPLQAEKDRR